MAGVFKFDTATNGIVIPSKTTVEKDAIIAPDTGLIVYDSSLGSLQIRDSVQSGYFARFQPTNFVLAGNVVTCTCPNDLSIGNVVMITNVNATGFNALLEGKSFTVSTASGANFTFPYVNADVASAVNTNGFVTVFKPRTETAAFNTIFKGNMRMLFYDDFLFINRQLWTAGGGGTINLEGLGSTLVTLNTQNAIYYWTSPTSYPVGSYRLDLSFIKYNANGRYDIEVSCGGGGYVKLMTGFDEYDGGFGSRVPLSFYFTSTIAGTIIFKFTNVGKHPTSTGYRFQISQPFVIYHGV